MENKNSFRFFANRDCAYYPCHPNADPNCFNCLFCYCPLYPLGEGCGGNFSFTENGIKDCTNCLIPHTENGYQYILDRISKVAGCTGASLKPTLRELIAPYSSVSIIGMCKNAGKTTVLNEIIRELSSSGYVLGLTSIGRDGESKDLVTGTHKPGIYVREGTLVATASDLVLNHCDVTRELLDNTGISTPMGDVIVLRARSDGNIQLAGPSLTSQLAVVRDAFFRMGAQKVIIDGALSRKTLCSRKVTQATILCTGASYHKDMDTVIEDTAYTCEILTLPEVQDDDLHQAVERMPDSRSILIACEDGTWIVPADMGLEKALRDPRAANAKTVFFGGALSDFLLKPLLMSSEKLEGLTFVVRDSTKILIKQEIFEKLRRRGVNLQVLDSVNLVAVAVNPFSAYGFHFPKEELMARMEARVDLPVINVREVTG